ncbi:hypothetical protein [Marinobacterium maritimum]|uniref:hypothetical protein n=1 Tax=Marinobacterium maritimum TaxID=500162 RepID=UPI0031E417B1
MNFRDELVKKWRIRIGVNSIINKYKTVHTMLRRMGISWIRSKGAGLLAPLLICSSSAHATSQCPREFGQKDPLVDAIGWLVVAVGIIVGGLLFTYIIRRSRGIRWFSRSIVIIIGFAGMLLVWIGGFALAFVNFFFKC